MSTQAPSVDAVMTWVRDMAGYLAAAGVGAAEAWRRARRTSRRPHGEPHADQRRSDRLDALEAKLESLEEKVKDLTEEVVKVRIALARLAGALEHDQRQRGDGL